jgi:hypothetical protein
MRLEKFRQGPWPEILGLAVISALAYLVHLGGLVYYRDDWYYMYDGLAGGGRAFVEMFRHMRPARGPLFELLFGLFGTSPFPYLILLYLWRLAGGLAALWLFRLLWPKQRGAAFLMALLYVTYPGFLWWVQGFEYQPMVLSAGLQALSILMSLKVLQSAGRGRQVLWMLGAILTGWAYLSLVEYAFGMEVLRWLCIYLFLRRDGADLRTNIMRGLRAAAVTLVIPAGFLLWHQFIFENWRPAADLGRQLGAAIDSPGTLVWWAVHGLQSFLNISLFAWLTPLNQLLFSLRLKDTLLVFGWAALAAALSTGIFWGLREPEQDERRSGSGWQYEAIGAGLAGVLAGILPIIVANRAVTFDRFSHYSLPASLAAVMLVAGVVYLLPDPRARLALQAALIGSAVLTHGALAAQARGEEEIVRRFWHQVAWRVPGLRAGTLLVVNYAGLDYREGNDIAWGPANFIYHPRRQDRLPIVVPVAAARMEADTPKSILEGTSLSQTYLFVNQIESDFGNLLVMSLPSADACVHVLDARWAETSVADTALIGLAAPRSRIENVLPEGDAPALPAPLFGGEPPHEWCYYYEKAGLARQRGDWDAVTALGNEAGELDLHPNDPIEWMPFLQAAALAGDEKLVRQISTRINTEQLYKQAACSNLKAMQLSPEMAAYIRGLFCGGR